jgi:hypothetical protein
VVQEIISSGRVESKDEMRQKHGGIGNLFTFIDELSPQRELFRAIKSKNGV